ncbi:restriction endonuclease subunit S [Halobacillus kuroshimensis]|uniref:restriction endonuclease subunit S n=1 Tax=Halobacillus kuroshimensis TaxID=302481 RepID=UPI00041542BE|nr:restriction endonuclease subunit S [Halobacillus kuroshimensis]
MSKKKNTIDELLEEAIIPEDEHPYEVPMNWVWTYVKSISEVKGGKRLPKGEKLTKQITEHPYLRVVDLRGGTVDEDDLNYITKDVYEKISRYTIGYEDVYITIAGTIGRVGTIPYHLNGANLTENAAKITNIKTTNKNYLSQVLESNVITQQISAAVRATSQPKLALHRIKDLAIPLPPLNEQKRIAEKVERLLNKVEEAKQLIEEAKETFEHRRLAILDKAFRGELTANWRKKHNQYHISINYINETKKEYYESLEKKANSVEEVDQSNYPFNIPTEWKWVKAIDVCDVRDGTHDSPKYMKNGYPLITSKNLKFGEIDFSNVKYISETDHNNINKRSKVNEGDILFAMIGTIGNPVLIREIKEEFSIKNVALFKSLKSVNEEFLAYYLESINYLEPIKKNAKGSTQKFVGLNKLRESLIPIPPLEEQLVIVKELKKLLNYEKQSFKKIRDINIGELRESILLKAFRGELGTNDPTEENAIELLKESLQEQVK